jgi:opacity protein-like surface antigen
MRLALLAAAALLVAPINAQAQSLLEGWSEGQVTVYGWFPSIDGAQEFPDGDPVIDLEAPDILDLLNFGFFGAGEIRRGRVGLAFDIAYADLGQDGEARGTIVPGADPANSSVDTTLLMATGAVAYRFYEDAGRWADVYGGVRALDVDTDVTLRIPSIGFRADRSSSVNWVDAIVGLRGHAPLGERFAVTGLADVGGFGIGESSNPTWQVQGTLDYAFTDRFIGRLGYRYMSIDYDVGPDLRLDMDVYGPLLGVTWTF